MLQMQPSHNQCHVPMETQCTDCAVNENHLSMQLQLYLVMTSHAYCNCNLSLVFQYVSIDHIIPEDALWL